MTMPLLGMPRHAIKQPPEMIRAFSGRGAVSLRDHTLTGLQSLQFTPFEQPRWRFELSFLEETTGCLIEDSTDDIWQHHLRTGEGHHPLGLNFGDTALPDRSSGKVPTWVLLLQECEWSPNEFVRVGTFHKRVDGKLISFRIETTTRVDERRDQVHLQVRLTNRAPSTLNLLARSRQRIGLDDLQRSGFAHTVPVWQWPGGKSIGASQFETQVSSDQPSSRDGWSLQVGPAETLTSHFSIALYPSRREVERTDYPVDLSGAFATAGLDTKQRLTEVFSAMPSITSPVPGLEELYNRSLLSIVDSRWIRDDWPLSPFYAAGSWLFTLAWDTSFASAAIALFDPNGARSAIICYFEAGLLKHSYVGWDGSLGHHYAHTAFGGLRVLRDYLEVSGDIGFLDATLSTGQTIYETVESVFDEMSTRYSAPDGLADFGSNPNDYLETRTDGYQSRVAIASLMLIDAFEWLASTNRSKAYSERWQRASAELREKVNTLLWSPAAKWYRNRMADGSTELVWSYQLYDALLSPAIDDEQREGLLAGLVDGAFLGRYGMYSVAKFDSIHFDLDDADWGGGGQYLGQTLRIVEYLWRLGESERAWDLLKRCIPWAQSFPYLPQEIYTDELRSPDIEQAVVVSAGAGAQAIIFGLFGIHPQSNQTMKIEPTHNLDSIGSTLTGYRHMGRSYDVRLLESSYRVTTSKGDTLEFPYGTAATIGSDGELS